jgi:hypothetical protein
VLLPRREWRYPGKSMSSHREGIPGLLLTCSRVRAIFAPEGIILEGREPLDLQLDEHGGTYVLRVVGLEVSQVAEPAPASGIWLEVALPPEGVLLPEIAAFAAQHRLALAPVSPPPAELLETPILAACHIPGKNLFIYGEATQLRVRLLDPRSLELTVAGEFRARRVPCREPDIVLHLTAPSMARLLAFGAAAGRTPSR